MENDYAYDDDEEQTQQATQSTQQPSQANPVDVNLWGILQPCNANNPRMEFSKTSPTIRIGRNPQNAFVLPGARVSEYIFNLFLPPQLFIFARKAISTVR